MDESILAVKGKLWSDGSFMSFHVLKRSPSYQTTSATRESPIVSGS